MTVPTEELVEELKCGYKSLSRSCLWVSCLKFNRKRNYDISATENTAIEFNGWHHATELWVTAVLSHRYKTEKTHTRNQM